MTEMKYSNIVTTFVHIVCLMIPISSSMAQTFHEVEIRDIAKMQINYGNAVADYDLDGDLDVFIVAYNPFDASDPQTWSRLLENKGGWFEDVTVDAGFGTQYSGGTAGDNKIGASWGDYDNDGYPDLFLAHGGGTQLYQNNGNKTFSDVSASSNIAPCKVCVNTSGLWWDYDNDGDLDLYISDYQNPNRLFNNQGDGTFKDLSLAAKLDDAGGTWCSIPIDANNDGWLDLYVVNDYGHSRFYINENGNSFRESTTAYGLKNTGNAMGATVGDYNNDGHLDIYITNIAEFQSNPLFAGKASGGFEERALEEGVENGHWAWGTHFFDADHDGDEDLYVVNGWGNLVYNNKFFKNLRSEGEDRYEDWSDIAACDGEANGMGAEVFDYDNDGDLDILVSNTDNKPYFYRNVGQAPGTSWLQVDLEGTVSNRSAIGTRLVAAANGKFWHRFHHGAGIMAQSIKPVHFGLGGAGTVDSLMITWPNGDLETIYDLKANQKVKIIEGVGVSGVVTALDPQHNVGSQPVSITAYPNPFYESVEFEVNARRGGTLHLQIYSLQGRKIFELQTNIASQTRWRRSWDGIDMTGKNQGAGMYIFHIMLNNERWSGKLLHQR